jgi:RNA polymerase sigma-70 factor (ECF subfamily)
MRRDEAVLAAPSGTRPVVYCVIPWDLAERLHEPLRRHFVARSDVEVVVERRARERRAAQERRSPAASPSGSPPGADRRRILAAGGRRAGERRAVAVAVTPMELPRRVRPFAAQLLFVERVEPSGLDREDIDTDRLIARIQSGDREAFAALYQRYFDRVYGYLSVALRDHHLAEDGAQHVFMRVFESLPGYARRSAPFRAWLFVVVRNHAISQLRRSKRIALCDPAELDRQREAEAPAAAENVLDWISNRELLMFIERLPLAQREVLVLRYVLDLTFAQIAAALGRSPDDVRMLQHRALTMLRQRLAAVEHGGRGRSRASIRRCRDQAPVLRMRRFALGHR